jgi:hypothetical protein
MDGSALDATSRNETIPTGDCLPICLPIGSTDPGSTRTPADLTPA